MKLLPNYKINKNGTITEIKTGRKVRQFIIDGRSFAYVIIKQSNNCGKVFKIDVAEYVLRKFVGDPPTPTAKAIAKNNKPSDCRLRNLQWREPVHPNAISVNLISPDNETVSVVNVSEFSRLNNLDQSTVSKLVAGKRRQHKGWRTLH